MKTTTELMEEYFNENIKSKNDRLKFDSCEEWLGVSSQKMRIYFINIDTNHKDYFYLSTFDYSTFLFNKINS
jgi:hypothetical protein